MLTANIAGVNHAYELTDNRSEAVKTEAPSTGTPTLVFVHGWLLSRAYWKPLIEQISTQYRCLTYDLRGFGDSVKPSALDQPTLDKPTQSLDLPKDRICLLEKEVLHTQYAPSAYSLAAYAHDLNGLLEALNIGQAWVLGHSLGGSIALWAAYLYPKRVAGVFCINAGGGIYIAKEFEKFRSAGQQMVKFRPAWLQRIPGLASIFFTHYGEAAAAYPLGAAAASRLYPGRPAGRRGLFAGAHDRGRSAFIASGNGIYPTARSLYYRHRRQHYAAEVCTVLGQLPPAL